MLKTRDLNAAERRRGERIWTLLLALSVKAALSPPTFLSPGEKEECVYVRLRAERNRSCEKRFQLIWQNGKGQGSRQRRQPIRPEAGIRSLPSFFLGGWGVGGRYYMHVCNEWMSTYVNTQIYCRCMFLTDAQKWPTAGSTAPPVWTHMCVCVV